MVLGIAPASGGRTWLWLSHAAASCGSITAGRKPCRSELEAPARVGDYHPPGMPPPPSPRLRAELISGAWEVFSALLFVSAVVPAAFSSAWPAIIFASSLSLSALLSRRLIASGARGFALAGALRAVTWPLAISPILDVTGPAVLVAGIAFGLMAGGMRRAVYHRVVTPEGVTIDDATLLATLRPRLGESAMVAGIVGGHAMLLFSVAFLRTQSSVVFKAWWQIVPLLAVLGTVGFTLAVRPATRELLEALRAGPKGDRALLERGLSRAMKLPSTLSWLNFSLWFTCTAIGVFYFRTGPASWEPADAVMQLGFGSLFAWGVSFYQRAWHRDTAAPAIERLRRWTGAEAAREGITLQSRMLRDFGLPLLFTGTLSLFSSIGLYRALGSDLPLREDFNAITALFASFVILVIAVGGVVARAARELSRPMSELASAADAVAHGKLDRAVPPVAGPVEVVGLGESIEGMREALARTIAELEQEREGLEANVEARTAELRNALDELRRTQAALIQGERLASIGELVAGVAHEIYNPLNAIAGASEPLERVVDEVRSVLDAYRAAERELPPERRRALEELRRRVDLDATLDDLVGISTVVKRATDRSVRIVQNLRNFSRVSGEAVPSDLHAGIEETLMLLAPRLRAACIQVTKKFGELGPVTCRAGEINQVFMNLLTNAIQALEASPGPERETPEITIETWVEGDSACVAVTDNGPGVPKGLEQRIFDPFFTTKPRGQGTGLGLSISTEIVRRHGGTLTLRAPAAPTAASASPAKHGASLVCRIPLEAARVADPGRASSPDAARIGT